MKKLDWLLKCNKYKISKSLGITYKHTIDKLFELYELNERQSSPKKTFSSCLILQFEYNIKKKTYPVVKAGVVAVLPLGLY